MINAFTDLPELLQLYFFRLLPFLFRNYPSVHRRVLFWKTCSFHYLFSISSVYRSFSLRIIIIVFSRIFPLVFTIFFFFYIIVSLNLTSIREPFSVPSRDFPLSTSSQLDRLPQGLCKINYRYEIINYEHLLMPRLVIQPTLSSLAFSSSMSVQLPPQPCSIFYFLDLLVYQQNNSSTPSEVTPIT